MSVLPFPGCAVFPKGSDRVEQQNQPWKEGERESYLLVEERPLPRPPIRDGTEPIEVQTWNDDH